MQDQESKRKVLQEIMDLMDEKDGEQLKRHPKFVSKATEAEEPEIEGVEVSVEGEEEPEAVSSDSELSPEVVQKLLEMYDDLD